MRRAALKASTILNSSLAEPGAHRISDGRTQMARRWKDEPAFKAVLNEIRAHNDRTAAIVAGATLEYALQLAIEARYPAISEEGRKKLFDSRGILSSCDGGACCQVGEARQLSSNATRCWG